MHREASRSKEFGGSSGECSSENEFADARENQVVKKSMWRRMQTPRIQNFHDAIGEQNAFHLASDEKSHQQLEDNQIHVASDDES